MQRRKNYISLIVIGLSVSGAIAQDVPDYGFDFVTISDVGNRNTNEFETDYPDQRVGRVDYEYRMATTEVTIGQYFEFVVAYLPIYEQNTGNVLGEPQFTGFGIRTAFGKASLRNKNFINHATTMSWEYAARYVNWLHNGKVVEEWAFETGVYDTNTFTQNNDGSWNHQLAHSPHARYWIPTSNEWLKAAYWDTNKNNGEGGYWRFPNGSDFEPIPALLPTNGGERNSGPQGTIWPLDVQSFQGVQSPWGLFDMAGGEAEFLETISNDRRNRRFVAGSNYLQDGFGDIFSNDIICFHRAVGVTSINGLRLAASVPSLADLNQDGRVNFFDISVFIRLFVEDDLAVDFNGDGYLGIQDVNEFIDILINN